MTGGASPRRRGDYFERQARAEMQRHGWLVVRAGGSLGPADLVALHRDQPPRLISCKLGNRIDPAERATLITLGRRHRADAVVMWRAGPGKVVWRYLYQVADDDAPAHR